jgi:methionyl-tRNA formyltransferase
MRLIFMGSPEFAVVALRALVNAGHEIVCVYSQPPRPKGRGQTVEKTPVHQAAEELGLMVLTPATFKDPIAVQEFQELKADLAVVAAYGLILRQPILNGTKHGCINIHASLLPRWRGAAPIHRAIEAGDSETGITIMRMDIGLDTGPMLLRDAMPIDANDTTHTLHDKLAQMGGRLIVKAIAEYTQLQGVIQPEEGVTYAHKISKEESAIDWTLSADDLLRKLRAFTPFPGLWMHYNGERMRIHQAHKVQQKGTAGQVVDRPFVIACGRDAIAIDVIQRENKKAQTIAEFCRGFEVKLGESCHVGS